jgi:hypothetical protein
MPADQGVLQAAIIHATDFIYDLQCPRKVDCRHVLVLVPLLVGRRGAGPLFVVIPPVRTLADRDDVSGTLVFVR